MDKCHFCDNEQDANELFELVKQGIKTATCELFLCDEQLVKAKREIITNWNGSSEILIENTKVYKIPFCNVDEKHAYLEGEGDMSLEYWKRTHLKFFKEECAENNKVFTENTLIVCIEFQVIKLLKE